MGEAILDGRRKPHGPREGARVVIPLKACCSRLAGRISFRFTVILDKSKGAIGSGVHRHLGESVRVWVWVWVRVRGRGTEER